MNANRDANTSGNSNGATSGISQSVVGFIREHIASIELLEVLLLFHATPERAWTADAVAAELRLQPRSVETRCAALVKAGLLVAEANSAFRYAKSAHASAVVDELASTYRMRRVSVIELIFSKPASDAPRAFADAFVIRKGDRDG